MVILGGGAAAVLFLHSVPAGGNDIPLELVCVSAAAVMGGLAGLAKYLRRGGADVLTRLVVLFVRGRRMTAGAAALPAPVRAGTHV